MSMAATTHLFALDVASGQILWQKTFTNPVKATKPPDWQCSNTPRPRRPSTRRAA